MKTLFAQMSRIFLLMPIIIFALSFSSAFAARELPPLEGRPATPTEGTIIATVNLYNLTIVNQKENAFAIAFDVFNRVGIQPEVIYSVSLLQKNSKGVLTVVDKKVYENDILSLGAGTTIHKNATYVAQGYLSGKYSLRVEARNSDGMLFGFLQSPEVTLTKTEGGVSFDASQCFLTVKGDDVKYTIRQGVDISQEETLTAHCSIENIAAKNITITPLFQTYYRSSFGKKVGTEKGKDIVVEPGKKLDFTSQIPKIAEPQAYDTVLYFTDAEGKQISPSVTFHFVQKGPSATIGNLVLDKDYYAKGDTANLTLTWSGPADAFPDSRLAPTRIATGTVLSLSLLNDQKQLCIANYSKKIESGSNGGVEKIALSVINNCANPMVSVKIVDPSGKILAQKSYDIQSKNVANLSNNSTNNVTEIVLYVVFLLIIGAMIWYFMKKRNASQRMNVFLGLMLGLGIFSFAGTAKADTYVMPAWNAVHNYFDISYVWNYDKPYYNPGDTMTLSSESFSAACLNELGLYTVANINGENKSLQAGYWIQTPVPTYLNHEDWIINQTTNTWTAPSVAGTYNAVIKGHVMTNHVWWLNYGLNYGTLCDIDMDCLTSKIDSPYTVIDLPAFTFTASPTSIKIGDWSTLQWSAVTNATSCTSTGGGTLGDRSIAGGILGVTSTGNDKTYTLTCTGPGGTVAHSVTVTVIPRPAFTFTATPTSVAPGGSSTLQWSAPTNSAYCTASGGTFISTTGSSFVVNPNTSTAYTLACTGPGGTTSNTVIVTVIPLPDFTLTASPSTVAQGGSSNITWSAASNAVSCTASGAWSGSIYTTGGTTAVNNITADKTYTLTCTGLGGSTTKTATISVILNGSCGTANGKASLLKPTTNLCSIGTASAVTPNNTTGKWNWTCTQGTAVDCSAKRTLINYVEY